jgi:cytochrome P450
VARNPLEALTGIAREYGDIVRVPLGPRAVYLVTHPDLIKHVLVDNSAGYSKGRTWEKTRSYLGDGLATAEGELWRRQRRLMQPQFHRDAVGSLAGVIADNIAVTIDHLGQAADEDRVVDLAAELMNMTLGVLKATVFGGTATDTTGFTDAFQVALAHTTARVLAPIDVPDTWPTPGNRRFREAKAHLDRVVFGVIRERSAEPDRPDLLSLLLHSKDPETGAVMGDTQLRDEVITLFLGGSETTANALAWAFYLLGQHQDVEERVAAEAREVIGERRPGADDLKRLQLCTAVFEEAMRLYPQNWVMSRDTIGEDVVGGYRVPARTTVFLGVHALHRDGRFWSDPERFLPERFFAANAVGRHPFAYLPFGGGQRKCIGNMFALLEGSFALAQIARAFVVEPVAGHTVVADPKFNLRPKTGIRVRLRRRSHR